MSEICVLSDEDVARVLDLDSLLNVLDDAFVADHRGAVERPDRPHFPVGTGLDPEQPDAPLGTGLVMPAYVHGANYYATKVVGVFEGNTREGLPTVNATVVLTDAGTGMPVSYLAGTRLTNARTGCIGGLAARELAADPTAVDLGVIGAGTQARWQARAIAAATNVERVRVFSPSDSRYACADDLEDELGVPAEAVSAPREATKEADVLVTATTATEPVFPGEALASGTTVIAVGAYTAGTRELDSGTIERADRVVADVPAEAIETGDFRHTDLDADDLLALGAVCDGAAGRETMEEIVVAKSVGTAVADAAAAEHLYDLAVGRNAGMTVPL
jgi:alanine dehydrogenase